MEGYIDSQFELGGGWGIDPQFFHTANYLPDLTYGISSVVPDHTSSSNTPSYSSDSRSDTPLENVQNPRSKKRRQRSESSQPDALIRPRKTRTLRAPQETAKVREKGACLTCKRKRKECQDGDHPDGPCRPCLERADKITFIPGLLRPLCWRPNIGGTEVFRRGPTIDFAVSLRGNMEDEAPGKQAIWKHFAVRRIGNEPSKTVELSQGVVPNRLKIRLDRYQPKDTDRQYYQWFNNEGVQQKYHTPAYGIENLSVAQHAIEGFLRDNSEAYIETHLKDATEITRKTFHTAQQNKHLPLVERALKLWVGCRFIEDPWSIVGTETLSQSRDPNPACPYHTKIPVPPIVDLQLDLIVINELLQPELKKILKMLKTLLESSDPWNNWFEIYLAYFILLHNVELTMAHDAWFVKWNNLKRKYSNKNLVDTIMAGATTLLTVFHYAHQGYAPFSQPELDETQNWPDEMKDYLGEVRPLVKDVGGDCVQDPAREMFWTSQLMSGGWRPVVLVS
ncbi:hypothetical protein N431DRAFT_435586 [Stipitochalara longipes BDJ]|nr:hypothetical protein N431DRAFT_435586 [Stipitochalara longipes BDJ]